VEVVSDEEMALIDAALAAAAAGARPLVSSTARRTAAQLSCAAYSAAGGDIEDSPVPRRSLLARFRERRALAITDITATVTRSPTPKALAFSISLSPGQGRSDVLASSGSDGESPSCGRNGARNRWSSCSNTASRRGPRP